VANHKTTSNGSIRKKEEHSRKKPTIRYIIFNGKDLVRGRIIIKNVRT